MDSHARRAEIVRQTQAETGIDEALIARLVHDFYDAVRRDVVLGPVFAARIEDWDAHLGRMCAFWSSVLLMSGRYHGQPMAKHAGLPVDAAHFDRWLELFEATATAVCPPAAAARVIDRARRIAESLELGVAAEAGVFLARGERYRQGGGAKP